jgi:hypothetical protein
MDIKKRTLSSIKLALAILSDGIHLQCHKGVEQMKKIIIGLGILAIVLIAGCTNIPSTPISISNSTTPIQQFCLNLCLHPNNYTKDYIYANQWDNYDFSCTCNFDNGTTVNYYLIRRRC